MFRRTRRQLVILNSLVFFAILAIFGTSVYFYAKHRLYSQVDASLMDMTRHLQTDHYDPLLHNDENDQLHTLHIQYVLWDENGNLVKQFPSRTAAHGAPPDVSANQALSAQISGSIHTFTMNGHQFRTMSFSPPGNGLILNDASIRTIQLLYNLEAEQNVLRSLLMVIEIGTLLCAGVAMLAGLYLANRALVPIQNSWNQQQQFVADASHELRTPLSVMQVHLEWLFRHPARTIEQESESISTIMTETRRMRKLVTDLLTLAGANSNQALLSKQPVQLDALVTSVVEQFRYVADLKNIVINLTILNTGVIQGDESRIRQLLHIVLDNAIKYTQRDGSIEVKCQTHGSLVHLDVSDTGMGISEEDAAHIFDRFYRADKARTRTQEGTGLGLAIAKWIVLEHGGKIRAESQLGAGTTIHIILPIS